MAVATHLAYLPSGLYGLVYVVYTPLELVINRGLAATQTLNRKASAAYGWVLRPQKSKDSNGTLVATSWDEAWNYPPIGAHWNMNHQVLYSSYVEGAKNQTNLRL